MADNEKRLIRYGVVIPVIVALVLSVISCAVLAGADFPFTQRMVYFSDYQQTDIKQPSEFGGELGETVKKQDIMSCISDNTIIGSIAIENSEYPIIYNGNEVNASGKFNIKNNILIGEAGICFAEIYKSESNMLKILAVGDTVNVSTFYSVYEYEVVDTLSVSNSSELSHCGMGYGRALVLYTDNSIGMGIGDDYYVCICKAVSGSRVMGG